MGSTGTDTLRNLIQLSSFFDGLASNDTLTGTSQNDIINGGAGVDSLTAGGGIDLIDGGTGIDTLDILDLSTATNNISIQILTIL